MAQRIFRVLLLIGALVLAFFFVKREYLSRWGATEVEAIRELPGDHLIVADTSETHAVTINAKASDVWPWVAQLGQDRGGFYGWTILEDLVGAQMPRVDRVHPEWQAWEPGASLWMYPKEKGVPGSGAPMRLHRPGEALVFATSGLTPASGADNGTWAFIVEPIDEHRSRLIVRSRAVSEPVLEAVARALVFDPLHFAMERRMMLGIKMMAEGGEPTPTSDVLEVVSFALTGAAFFVSIGLALRKRTARRGLAGMALSGLAFQGLGFVQPGATISVLTAVTVLVALVTPTEWPLPWYAPTRVERIRDLAAADKKTEAPELFRGPSKIE